MVNTLVTHQLISFINNLTTSYCETLWCTVSNYQPDSPLLPNIMMHCQKLSTWKSTIVRHHDALSEIINLTVHYCQTSWCTVSHINLTIHYCQTWCTVSHYHLDSQLLSDIMVHCQSFSPWQSTIVSHCGALSAIINLTVYYCQSPWCTVSHYQPDNPLLSVMIQHCQWSWCTVSWNQSYNLSMSIVMMHHQLESAL